MNRQVLDPVLRGAYPELRAEVCGAAWPSFPPEDRAVFGGRIDVRGVDYYARAVTGGAPQSPPGRAGRARQDANLHPALDWEDYPQALTDVLVWVRDRYGPIPLYDTENGAAFEEPPTASGPEVADPLRVAYLRDHLRAAHAALAKGVDLRGYFAWSLLDNFEWAEGFSKRFGLYHVDFATQQRTPKASARFYRAVIQSNGGMLDHGPDSMAEGR
jgi:beta-glucosidase